jgi:hypothetical protein
MNHSSDFPLLTDVLGAQPLPPLGTVANAEPPHAALDWAAIQEALSVRLIESLSLQIPVLLNAALREHLPQAMGARLQVEILTALTSVLPAATQAASAELSNRLAYEVGGVLEQRLQEEVRFAVAEEIARLSQAAS